MRLTRARRTSAALVATVGVVAALSTTGTAATTSPPAPAIDLTGDNDLGSDSRVGSLVRPTDAQVDAVRGIVAESPGARATWDLRFGSVRTLTPAIGERLSDPSSGSAVDVARSWLTEHRAMLGLSSAEVADLVVRRDHVLPGTGTHVVSFQQRFGSVTAVRGGSLSVTVADDGSVVSYTGQTVRTSELASSFELSEARALLEAAGSLAPGVVLSPKVVGDQAGYTVFARGPFAQSSYVKRTAFPTADGVRAAYSVLFVKALDKAWQVVIDAQTGDELYRYNLVQHADDTAGGTVYPNYPGAPGGGQPQHVSFDATEESPKGYVDLTGLTGVGVTTFGNNANAHANWSNFIAPVDPGPRPVEADAQFDYVFTDEWGTSSCDPTSYPGDLNPSATNLFWQHNRIHDEFYGLGFTESGGNFQVDNFGNGGNGGDAIQGLVQAGAVSGGSPTYTGRDNAYMLTLPDGIPPWSGMFLWEPINDAFEGPCRDGDFDAGVIEHEYAHGLSNRYVGTEDGALGTHQSGSMGEGWGDWYGLNYLHREGYQTTSELGGYATGNTRRGIRNWAYDVNPTTFGDIGYDLVGPEVHADGEIWTAALWEMRRDLVERYGQQLGSEISARIVTDAMPLSPNDPSMLDMRTAIMTALDNRYHARSDFDTLVDTVYSVFAKRGMGLSAYNHVSENDPTGGNDVDPVPGFDNRNPDLNGVLAGTVVNSSTGQPVENARVMLGRFEARTSPVAVTGSTGGVRVTATEGTYPVTVQAKGFGSRTFNGVAVEAGSTNARTFVLQPNLASTTFGAKALTGSSGKALDDTEASSWKTPVGSSTVVKLARKAQISTVQVSAYTSSRFEGLRAFTLQYSIDGVNWKTLPMGNGAFGYQAPRPVVPDLHYKRFVLGTPVTASHVRFWADAAQGETKASVQVAEIQVFSQTAGGMTPPPPPPPDPPRSETFTIAAGNPANVVSPGVVGAELENACVVPPASQGSDGYVSLLRGDEGDGQHAFALESSETNVDADVYLYDAECTLLASYATSAANEAGSIPSGTAYVLTHLYVGAAPEITLTIADTQ